MLTSRGKVALILSLGFLLPEVLYARHGSTGAHGLHRRQSGQGGAYPMHNISIPIDHFHNESRYEPHTDDTFAAFYEIDASTYQEGGPVIVATIGEDSFSFDEVWLKTGLIYQIAKATNGLMVLWAQRYYSGGNIVSPEIGYTTQNLRFHSTEQAMADLAYFSTHVEFPGLPNKNLTAPGTPWILVGGSYGGVISAFSRIQYPNLFWGALSSSGVTRPIIDFWQFADVMRRYGPPMCIKNIQTFTAVIDNIFESSNKTAIKQLKTAFNVQSLTLNTDFAWVLTSIISEWEGQFWPYDFSLTGPNTFCGNITASTNVFGNENLTSAAKDILRNGNYAASSTDLLTPLLNFIGTVRSQFVDLCQPNAAACDASSVVNQPSPYPYLNCIEQADFATSYRAGAPGRPKQLPILSRLLTAEYYIENCRSTYNFSAAYKGPDLECSLKYGGWKMQYPRLALSAGELDAYRPITALAEFISTAEDARPYVPNPRLSCTQGDGVGRCNGTESEPQIVIEGALHEWDLNGAAAGDVNATFPPKAVKDAHVREVTTVKVWLEEWKKEHGS